jgi:hypothetical protein
MLKIIRDEIKLSKSDKNKFTGSIKVELFRDDACTETLGTIELKAVGSCFHTEVTCKEDNQALHMIAYTVYSLIQEYFDYRELDSECYISLVNSLAKVVNANIQLEMAGMLAMLKKSISYQTRKPDCELVCSALISTLYPKYIEAEDFLEIE